MRLMQIRDEECYHLFAVRRPKNPNLIAPVLAVVRCPVCHPGLLKDCCIACRLPFSIFPMHSNEQCGTCVRRSFYWGLAEEVRITIRVQEAARWRASRVTKPELPVSL
jgi:hypothetical protein